MEEHEPASVWTGVDATADPSSCVQYLDAVSAMARVQAYKRQSLAFLDVREGHRVLDVGCGTGDDVCALAALVGRAGLAVGIDNSEIMVAEANRRAEGLGLPVECHVGDAHNIDFGQDTFDACRADRTFQHLEDPQRALTEMIRVTRPLGRVVVSEPDWETLVMDTDDRILTRKILNQRCDSRRNGWIGRRLSVLFKDSGLRDIVVVPFTHLLTEYGRDQDIWDLWRTVEHAQAAGAVSTEEGVRWLSHLEDRVRTSRFFSAVTLFIVGGRKVE